MGAEELELLRQVIESGTLNCTKGTMVSALEREFARDYIGENGGEGWGCVAVTSGTAAIHTAIAAVDPEPGDEIVTTSITDMGALSPILYQGAIPVFADVDKRSFNVTRASIERVLSPRTRTIIVTHLFGAPCEMAPILELAARHNLPVIEDAAQAPFATYRGQRAGTMGDIGCFSLQQGKHMTAGEGGLVISRDAKLLRRMTLFHDKAWGYGDAQPDHYFLALNYRMTELQGAVALAQLRKVQNVVRDRQNGAALFAQLIADIPGVCSQAVPHDAQSVFWKYTLRIDNAQTGADVGQIARYLSEHFGIASSPRYVQKPAFECAVFREQRTFGQSRFPFANVRGREDVAPPQCENYPDTFDALAHMLVLPWNENYTDEHVRYIADALRQTVAHFRGASKIEYSI